MAAYKHILLATDLSDKSAAVSQKAGELAKLHHAKLSIAHVIEYTPPFYGIGEVTVPIDLDTEEELEQDAHQKIKALAHHLGVKNPSAWVLCGEKNEEIIKLVEKQHIDLIVVGGHHHHGLNLLFGNSLPSIMLHHLLCDILVVNLGPL
ncbi:MAG: universal stress protein [Gammaproteobacteria bacterium]|nr:universal stress protein [Gammaproteobacteria bacterium]